jgi:hypothetical protein
MQLDVASQSTHSVLFNGNFNRGSDPKLRQMALDFIAPGSTMADESVKPQCNELTLYAPMTQDLVQKDTWPRLTLPRIPEMNRPLNKKKYRSSPYETYQKGYYSSPPSSPSNGSTSPRNRSISLIFPSRSERHEYDPEERFAVVYLRTKAGLSQWKDVKAVFDVLFPPHQCRRPSAPPPPTHKAIPTTYPERTVGGLECRYYRIRELEGMGKVRDGRRDAIVRSEDNALFRMENTLIKFWLETISFRVRTDMCLARMPDETIDHWVARGRPSYRARSSFWNFLMLHASFKK